MQTYLAIIDKIILENGWYNFVFFAAIGIFIASMLLCLVIRARYRSKVVSLDAELTQERAIHAQERMQLSDDLNVAHEKIQQQEGDLTNQVSRIEQIESEKQAAQVGAARTAKLEGEIQQRNQYLLELLNTFEKDLELVTDGQMAVDVTDTDNLWQRHRAVMAELTNRLQTEERRCSELEQILQTGQTMLAEKEAVLEALRQSINDQVAHIAKTEQDFVVQLNNADTALLRLQTKYRVYKKYFGGLAWGRMQVFNELNLAVHRIHQLDVGLETKAVPVEAITPQDEPQIIEVLESTTVAQEVHSEIQHEELQFTSVPEKSNAANPFARFVSALKTDFGLSKQPSEKVEVGDEQAAEPQEVYVEPITQQDEPQIIEAVVLAEVIQPERAEIQNEEHLLTPVPEQSKAANPLLARFVKAVKTDFGLSKPRAPEKIEELETKQIDQDDIQPRAETLVAIEEVQVKPSVINTVLEKAENLPQGIKGQWLNFFKKQTHDEQPLPDESSIEEINTAIPEAADIAPNAKTVQDQLNGFYQKLKLFGR